MVLPDGQHWKHKPGRKPARKPARPRKDGKPLPSLMPAMYSHRLAEIQQTALECGYAVAIHGSMARDLDVIAVPWYPEAVRAERLVNHLCDVLGCLVTPDSPAEKPHGRLAFTLLMGGACFMDLSVMPLTTGISEKDDG